MTREEAIKKHRELWHWIADETRKQRKEVHKWENPDVDKENPINDCWLCEYAGQLSAGLDCFNVCPIDWGSETCLGDGSPFNEWHFDLPSDYEEQAKLEEIIAELPEKN